MPNSAEREISAGRKDRLPTSDSEDACGGGVLPPLCLLTPQGFPGGAAATAAAKSLQSCPTLCDPIDGSPPGSPVPGILQARTLEWVAISFSQDKY